MSIEESLLTDQTARRKIPTKSLSRSRWSRRKGQGPDPGLRHRV